jgi:hypothetical protein
MRSCWRLRAPAIGCEDAGHRHGLGRHIDERRNELVFWQGEERVPTLLEGDGARRLAAHPGTTRGACEMAGEELEVIGEREQLSVHALVELRGILTRVAWKVWTANGTDEKGVARQDEPGLGAPPEVCHDQADALGRVARGVEHRHPGIAELELLTITKRFEWKRNVGGLVQMVRRTNPSRERKAARAMIGVDMRVDDVRDAHPFRGCERRVRIDILFVRVNDRALAERAAPEEIRRGRKIT